MATSNAATRQVVVRWRQRRTPALCGLCSRRHVLLAEVLLALVLNRLLLQLLYKTLQRGRRHTAAKPWRQHTRRRVCGRGRCMETREDRHA